jgi:hypothetical protein
MSPTISQLRIMQFVMIVSVLFIFFISRSLPVPSLSADPSMQWAIVVCAIASGVSGFILQRILLRASGQASRSPQASTPLARWRIGHMVRFATAESVALFGFVLRSLGASSTFVYLLFGGGMLLLVLWQPGALPTETESQNPIH